MAKKWSDVAASAAFQALSFEEQEEARRQYFEAIIAPQVPEEDVSLVRDQFFADTERNAGSGRGFINPPMATERQPEIRIAQTSAPATDYTDAATQMLGASPESTDKRGIIQRVGDFLRPAPKGSVLDQPASLEEQARMRQAEIDRRLAYGAGPIRSEVVQAADQVRSSRGAGNEIKFRDQSYADRVNKVVQEMDTRGERSTADIFESLNSKPIRDAVTEAKADEWRSAGEWAADTLSSFAQGVVTIPQLVTNIVAPDSSLAESLRETQKELMAQESDVLKAQREMLRQRVESEDGFLGKYWATIKELVTNPALTISESIKQVPMFIGVIGGARLGAAGGGAAASAAGRAAPTVALADAIGGGAVTAAARAAGGTIGGVGASMVMTGGDAAGSTYEELTDPRRTPLSEWKKNPDYQQLVQDKVAAGASEAEASKAAIQELAVAKARMSALITAPLGVLGFMGAEAAVASRGVRAATKDALTAKGAAGLIVKENVTEQLEEGGTQLGSNLLTGTVNTQKDPLENVAQAMATAGVTSTPFGAIGAYSQYRAAQEQQAQPASPGVDSYARAVMDPQNYQPELIAPQAAARQASDVGPSAPPQIANFTPAGSPTQRAGMVDIVVPLPGASTSPALGDLNVGTTGAPGGLAAAGSAGGGGVDLGGLGTARPGADLAAGGGSGAAPILGADDRSTLPAGGPRLQPTPGLNRPFERASDADLLARTEAAVGGEPLTWAGRTKTGYANEQDAEQAMATASTVIDTKQTHDWRIEPMGNGRFQIVGYPKETNLGTQTIEAQQTQAPGAAATGQAAGAAQGGTGGIPAATGATLELSDSERAGLKLAPTAPLSQLGSLNQELDKQLGVTFSPVKSSDLTDSQRLASAVARLMGKTLTVVHQETGAGALPNGMINSVGGKHLFVADDADDAPLSITMHEAYHGLPEQQRKNLNAALLDLFRQDRKGEFLDEFSYTPDRFEEEAPAMMVQAVSKREDFWQELRTKMGNKEFGEVAKTIIAKLGDIITGAKKQYGDDFVNKYISDVAKARDLLTTAYADAMKAQGLQPDVEVAGSGQVMASGRASTPETDAQAQRLGFDQPGPEAGEYAIAVSGLGDVIGRVVSSPGEPLRMEISPEYMGRRFGSKVAEGDAAIKAAIEWASDGIQQGRKKLAAMAMAEERGLPTPGAGPARLPMASERSRIGMDFRDVVKRTPELQAAAAKVQAGEMTAAEYDRLVNEAKPVEPYTSVPQPAADADIRTALTSDKVDRIGVPSKTLKAGDPVGLRLDIPAYSNHGTWVVSVHEQGSGYSAGKSIGYEPVAAATNVTFGVVEKAALNIAGGKPKATIAVMKGGWKPTTAAEAKLKADQALKSKDWVQVGMDPERHSYFYDRKTMEPVVSADEVIQIGPLVLAKNPTYGNKSEFMFSNKVSEDINAKLQQRIDSDFEGAVAEYSAMPGTEGGRLIDTDQVRELSPEYRADKTRAAEVHEASSDMTQRMFEVRVDAAEPGGIVAFMAGGGGAGKSTAQSLLKTQLDAAHTILDGTLSSYDKAKRSVQRALDRGQGVQIMYIYREPEEALRNGVLSRSMKTRRTVPVDALVKGHAGSSDVVRRLQTEFGDNPNFRIYAIDNSRGAGKAALVPLESITPVINSGLKERLLNATEAEYQAGRIDEQIYRSTVQGYADASASAGAQAQDGQVRQVDTGGAQGRAGPVQQRDAVADKPRRGTDRVGDFDVRTMKDGTIVVYGDAAAIRDQIPEDVKGRVTADGILFTTSAAPRVRAALEGRKTAYSRGGAVLDRLPMKDGKYVGAPEKYNTPAKIATLRKSLRKLTREGEPGRFWYENSSRAVLRMAGGNVQEARKFVALLSIYSPQAKVDANTTFALRAWAQHRAGQPIGVKTGVQDSKAQGALADVDAFWSGEKTGNFFFNLLREIDPTTAGKQGATIDMWMMRAGEYDNDAPTATQYAFMENETNRIAEEFGWEPQQVQAAIWVAMKARMENTGVKKRTEASSEKKGWIRFERNAKGVKVRVIIDAQKHRDNWLKHAFEHDPTKDDTRQAKFDFEDGLKRHIGQVSFEARPGRSTGILDGIHDAPYAQQVEFQQAVQRAFYDENGTDELAVMLGLLNDANDILRPGVWQGDVSPSTQKQVVMAPAKGETGKTEVDPAQAELLNVYASVAGLVARQEGVGWHRPFYAGTKRQSNGLDIDVGRALNPAETKDLEAAIGKWMADNGKEGWQNQFALISSPTGIRAVNFGIITNDVLQSEIVKVAEGVLPDFDYRVFASSGDMPTNDWKENSNGQGYVQRISAAGRSDVLEWARSVLAPRVQRVFEEFAEKYQWGDPGRIQFSNRVRSDAAGGGRDRGVGQEDVQAVTPSYGTPREGAASAVGYHYSTQPRTSLSSMMYGTGLRGAEMARLEGADPRLKQRVYFYIDRGTGINPEAGVGGQAHRVNLQNLYDVDEDALRLRRDNEAFNDFESAVIDAGFDGYMVRDAGPSGNAVLLGKHSVPVEQLGPRSRMAGEPVAPARERVLNDAEKISANKMLPAGQMSGKRWAEMISRSMPEVYERLADSPVWESDEVMYRSELARELRAQPMFSNRMVPTDLPQSAPNAEVESAATSPKVPVTVIFDGRTMRVPDVVSALKKLDAKINRYSELLKCLQ